MKIFSSLSGILAVNKKSMQKDWMNEQHEKLTEGAPFKLIPNVRRFKVIVSGGDKIFALFDIKKRADKATLIYENYDNNRLNRYLKHQIKRMKTTEDKLKFGRIGMHLVKRSNTFLIIALNHVFPNGHRNMELSRVIRLTIEVKRIASEPDSKLRSHRVYIEKSNGKGRPLGVPSPAGRIYLHMLNQILSLFMLTFNLNRPEQHGFVPGRGTLTAWQEILKNVINKNDIYEFDLKSFFDNINLDGISYKLITYGVPGNIVKRLYYINTCAVEVREPYKLNEFEQLMKKSIHKGAPFETIITGPRPGSSQYALRGVPQGNPTSPILATIGLEDSIINRPGLDCIMYADDGLYYGNNIDQPIITPNTGITKGNIYFNLNKSGGVKRHGQGLKPLCFLGLKYDPFTDQLMANTKKGSKLIYDKEALIDIKLKYMKQFHSTNTGENLIRSKLMGFIQNRLYQGDGNLDNFEQCFDLNYESNSFVDFHKSKFPLPITIFNSSSLASLGLVKKLRTLRRF